MKTVWQIGWKEERGGEMHLREEHSLLRTLFWTLRKLRKCAVVVVVRIKDD